MKKKMSMCEFVYGGCESAKKPEWFVPIWLKTTGNPCSVCCADKSKCNFYSVLMNSGGIGGGANSLRTS